MNCSTVSQTSRYTLHELSTQWYLDAYMRRISMSSFDSVDGLSPALLQSMNRTDVNILSSGHMVFEQIAKFKSKRIFAVKKMHSNLIYIYIHSKNTTFINALTFVQQIRQYYSRVKKKLFRLTRKILAERRLNANQHKNDIKYNYFCDFLWW